MYNLIHGNPYYRNPTKAQRYLQFWETPIWDFGGMGSVWRWLGKFFGTKENFARLGRFGFWASGFKEKMLQALDHYTCPNIRE